MADAAATKNVFIDTEVFDGQQLALDSSAFQRLARLAAEGDLRLLLTTVTTAEIRAHIADQADKSFKQIQNFKRILPPAKKVITPEMHAAAMPGASADQFRQSHLDAFDKFLADTKAIVLTIDDVSPEAIFKDYFECKPPFGVGDKKFEFPDAFAAAALKNLAAQERVSIYIVSADKDWWRVCQKEPALIHQGAIGELLEKFSDAEVVSFLREGLSERLEEVKALLDEAAKSDIYYFSTDGIEPEIEEADEVDVTIEDFHVIEADEGEATVSVTCKLHYVVTVVDADENHGYYDSEDGEMRFTRRHSGSVEGDIELEAKVTLEYDPDDPSGFTLKIVSFPQQDVEVSFDDGDLTDWVDEDDEYDVGDMPEEL